MSVFPGTQAIIDRLMTIEFQTPCGDVGVSGSTSTILHQEAVRKRLCAVWRAGLAIAPILFHKNCLSRHQEAIAWHFHTIHTSGLLSTAGPGPYMAI